VGYPQIGASLVYTLNKLAIVTLGIGICLVLQTACGGKALSSGSGGAAQANIVSITLQPATVSLIVGQTQQLTAIANYSDGTTKDVTSSVAWSASNAVIASISNVGLVTSVTAGQANVSATMAGVSATDAVTVTGAQPSVVSITLQPATLSLIVGQTQQLTAIANFSDGSTKDVTSAATWSSSNAVVAAISNGGLVTSVAAGQAYISATLTGIQGSTPVAVAAKIVTSIRLAPTSATLAVGVLQQLQASGAYNDGSTRDITAVASWQTSNRQTSNSAIASVGSNGVLTAVAPGLATITASLDNGTASVAISVTNATGGLVLNLN
jgi:trimeric autotransporter adhesin